MPRLTLEQQVWICSEYAKVNNAEEVLRRWCNLGIRTVGRTFQKFHCSRGNMLQYKSWTKWSAKENCKNNGKPIERVRQSLLHNERRSSRRNGLGLSRRIFQRIMKFDDIKFHPYVLVKRQKLLNCDPALRLAFYNRLLNTVNQNSDFLDRLIVSDKAIFSLNSEVNTRNVRNYAEHGNGHPPDHYAEFLQRSRGN